MTEQTWYAEGYDKNARFVSDLGMPVVELLNAKPSERILDLGCGDGALTKKLQDRGCDVVGIDSSPDLIRAALGLALNVSVQNAYEIDFNEEFDAVFSNAVLHWLKDADRVIRNVFRALRPGGRFVAECGGHKCCHTIRRRSSWSSRDAATTVGPRIRGTSRRPRTTEADWRRRDLPSRTSRSFLVQRLCLVTCPAFWRPSPVVLRLHYRMVTARHTLTMYVIG
jgi:SAM-dependent methyltransferase